MESPQGGLIDPDELPEINPALLQHLREAFPAPEVRPGADRDLLMFAAGQAATVDYLAHLRQKQAEAQAS